VAELFGVSAEDIAVKHLEEFPGIPLVLVCVGCRPVGWGGSGGSDEPPNPKRRSGGQRRLQTSPPWS